MERCDLFGDGKAMCKMPEKDCTHQVRIADDIQSYLCSRKPLQEQIINKVKK